MTKVKAGGLYNTSTDQITLVAPSPCEDCYNIFTIHKTIKDVIGPLYLETTNKCYTDALELGDEFLSTDTDTEFYRQNAVRQLNAHGFDTRHIVELWAQMDLVSRFQLGKVYKDVQGGMYLVVDFDAEERPILCTTKANNTADWQELAAQAVEAETEEATQFLDVIAKELDETLKRYEELKTHRSVVSSSAYSYALEVLESNMLTSNTNYSKEITQ